MATIRLHHAIRWQYPKSFDKVDFDLSWFSRSSQKFHFPSLPREFHCTFGMIPVFSFEIVLHNHSELYGISFLLFKVFSKIAYVPRAQRFSCQQWLMIKFFWNLISLCFICCTCLNAVMPVSGLWCKLSECPAVAMQSKPPLLEDTVFTCEARGTKNSEVLTPQHFVHFDFSKTFLIVRRHFQIVFTYRVHQNLPHEHMQWHDTLCIHDRNEQTLTTTAGFPLLDAHLQFCMMHICVVSGNEQDEDSILYWQ